MLVICGPTATGKTNLAIELSQKFNGELVSADSRQVYRGMNIGTGKDLPKSSKAKRLQGVKYLFYEIHNIKVWGYDLVDPIEEFSVSKYFENVQEIISNIWQRGKLAILVGGSGLYIKVLVDGIETFAIPRNISLREKLKTRKVKYLYELLIKLDKKKAESMNGSDRQNPRRLIRAIEIADYLKGNQKLITPNKTDYDSILMIGLKMKKREINKKILERVNKRIKVGFEDEIKSLLKKGLSWKCQSMQGMGYRQYEKYYNSLCSKQEFVKEWYTQEVRYAKRQMTWFKKDKRINWFDVSEKSLLIDVENKVQSWYYGK